MARHPHSVGLLEPEEPEAIAPADDNFDANERAITRALERGKIVEFNALSATGKQAALSLMHRRRARFVQSAEGMIVKKRKPRRLMRALTAGLIS